jgi:hypothetical protein
MDWSGKTEPAAPPARRAFLRTDQLRGASPMANHLTPEELSKEVGIERDEVIRICVEEHVPIYQGKIDKFLFQAQLEALRALPEKH